MQHIFIINPNAGRYNFQKITNLIQQICDKNHISYQIIHTQYAHHATSIAKKYDKKDNIIYAIGGDGSAYDIINGIKYATFSVLPFGTGNDFYRMIAPIVNNIEYMIEQTILGNIINIDYGKCNDHYFLNTTTIGIDAKVNDIVCTLLKKTIIPKPFLYFIAAIMAICKPDYYQAKINLDDKIIENQCLLIAIMNGKYYGNGVSPFKSVDMLDGYFDVCIIDKIPSYKLIWYLPKYFLGKIDNVPYIHIYKAKDIRITTDKQIISQSDGESFYSDSFNINNLHKAIRYQLPTYHHFYKMNNIKVSN